MSKVSDPAYLQLRQYQDSSNLSARAYLHQEFSTNPSNWLQWAFNQISVPENCRLLEIGCGPGYLWSDNIDQISPGWKLFLSDFSTGMAHEVNTALRKVQNQLTVLTLDAQQIPFMDGCFDTVISNHMLYHVPYIKLALCEIQRVLGDHGRLYAATIGLDHMRELLEWEQIYFQKSEWSNPAERFGLENGEHLLKEWFSKVKLVPYKDFLWVTEIDPLVNYIKSYIETRLDSEAESRFRDFIQSNIDSSGGVKITKEVGLFICEV